MLVGGIVDIDALLANAHALLPVGRHLCLLLTLLALLLLRLLLRSGALVDGAEVNGTEHIGACHGAAVTLQGEYLHLLLGACRRSFLWCFFLFRHVWCLRCLYCLGLFGRSFCLCLRLLGLLRLGLLGLRLLLFFLLWQLLSLYFGRSGSSGSLHLRLFVLRCGSGSRLFFLRRLAHGAQVYGSQWLHLLPDAQVTRGDSNFLRFLLRLLLDLLLGFLEYLLSLRTYLLVAFERRLQRSILLIVELEVKVILNLAQGCLLLEELYES